MKKSLSILLIVLVIIALSLVALRVALPDIVRDTLNDKMANMGEDYRGEVEDVELAIWRGAATLKNVSVHKIQDNEQVPFFQVPQADLSLRWAPLIKEQILAIKIHLIEPELNFVDGPDEQDQYGDEVTGAIPSRSCCRSRSTSSITTMDAFTSATSTRILQLTFTLRKLMSGYTT